VSFLPAGATARAADDHVHYVITLLRPINRPEGTNVAAATTWRTKMKFSSLVVIAATVAAMVPRIAAAQTAETLVVSLRGGPDAAVTSREYSGEWWLMAKGGGLAAATQASDAFFVYTASDRTILPPPGVIGTNEPHPWHSTERFNWVLSINGQSADAFVIPGLIPTIPGSTVPEYNQSHLYVVPIAGPGGPLTIGVNDVITFDNLGAYEVTIGTRSEALAKYLDEVTRWIAAGYIWGSIALDDNELHAAMQRATRSMHAGAEAEARAELEAVLVRLDAEAGVTIEEHFAAFARAAIAYLLRII
jgi:hypothetical protein